MADLGNLYFDILFRDKTQSQIAALKSKITKDLKAKVDIDFDRSKLIADVKSTLKSEKFRIDIVVDKAETSRAVREALRNAGLSGGNKFSTDDLRAEKALAARRKAEAAAAASLELARGRAARAAKAELDLANARQRSAEASRRQITASLNLNGAMSSQLSIAGQLKNEMLGLYSIYAVQNFLRSVVQIGGELENQRIAMSSILQDGGKAATIFDQIKKLAVASPFGVMDLNQYAKQLSAYSVPYNELYDTMKRLADISAGVGVDMGRIILAYGQIKAAKFLKGTELRQLTEANIPMVDKLAERFSHLEGRIVSAGEVLEMISEKKVSFEDVKEVLWDMTGEGGMFYNMQEVLSQSVKSKWKNLADAIDIMLGDMADAMNAPLKWTAEGLTELTQNWRELVPAIQAVVAAYGSYRAATFFMNRVQGAEQRSIISATLAAKQKTVHNLRLATSYRELSAAEKGVIASSGKMATADWKALASSGALTKEYALRYMALGRIKSGQAGHIAQMLGISRAEMKAAYSTTAFNVGLKSLSIGIRQVGVALKSLVFNPYTAIFAGIMLATEGFFKATQKADEMKEHIVDLTQKAQEGFKNLNREAKTFADADPLKMNDAALITSIEQMKTILKDYSPSWGNLFAEVFGEDESGKTRSLVEQYRLLAEAIRKTAEAYKLLNDSKEVFFMANDMTDGWLDESFTENVEDYLDAMTSARKELGALMKYNIEMQSVIGQAMSLSPEFAQKAAGKTLEQQIPLLFEYADVYSKVIELLRKESVPATSAFFDYHNSWVEAKNVLKNEVMPDLEEAAQAMRDSLTGKGFDFSNLTKEQEDAIRMGVQKLVATVKDITPEAQAQMEQLILEGQFGIKVNVEYNDAANKVEGWKDKLNELTNNEFVAEIKAASNMDDVIDNFRKKYKELQESLERSKPMLVSLGFDFKNLQFPSPFTPNALQDKVADEYKKNATDAELIKNMFTSLGISLKDPKNTDKDVFAEQMKERLTLIKDAYSEYKKWVELVGEAEALHKLKNSGVFADLFKQMGDSFDPSKIKENIQSVIDKVRNAGATTKERRDIVKSGQKELNLVDYDSTKRTLEVELEKMKSHIEKTVKTWDLYSKLFAATGDSSMSYKVAFSNTPVFDEASEALRKELEASMKEKGLLKDIDWDMDEEVAKAFFNGDKSLLALYKKVKEMIEQNGINLKVNVANAIKEAMSINDQIKSLEAQRDKELADYAANPTNGDAGVDALTKKWEKRILELKGSLTKMLPAFQALFKDTSDMTMGQLQRIRREAKALLDLIDRTKTPVTDSNGQIKGYKYKQADGTDGYISADDYEKYSRGIGKFGRKTNEAQKAFERLVAAMKGKSKDYGFGDWAQDLGIIADLAGDCAKEFAGMFDALGNESLADTFSFAGDMLSGAAGIGSSIASFASGDILGGITSGVSAITGIIGSIAGYHDKKLDRAIQRSEVRLERLQNIYDAIERSLEHFLGSGANIHLVDVDEDRSRLQYLQREISQMKSDGVSIFNLAALKSNTAEKKKLQARLKANDEGGAYGYQRALMQEQLAELETQRQAEIDKKKTDDSKVADYEAQIEEMRQEILYFAEETAEALYGINLKDWAGQLGDALYEAWQKGENGAEAFKNKVADIMGDVMNSILKVSLLEPAMQNLQEMLFGKDGMSGYFGKDFSLDNNELASIADYLMGVSEKTDDYYSMLDQLNEYMEKKYGVSMKEEEEAAGGGLSKGITGVTEDTANLLASYINAIRADVSMKREYMRQLIEELFPAYSIIAQAQLQQLTQIQINTANNVRFVEEIRDILHRNVNGNNKFNI